MGFADVNGPTLPPSAIGASQALRRNKFGSEEQIAEALLAQGYSPADVAEATGIELDGMDVPEGMDPGIDPSSPDSFGVMADDGASEEDGELDWLNTPDEESAEGEAQPPWMMPQTVEGGIDQEIDPMGKQAQAMADAVVPAARPAVSVLDGGAGRTLAAEVEKQKAATPEAPPPDPARIADILTGGASGGMKFDDIKEEPGFLDMLKSAGGKAKDLLSALAPSDAAAQGMMAAGLGMMGAQGTYGSTVGALGQGGLTGMKTYQTAKRREDIAQAKADQLKSLEKRADQTIRMKREELDAKKSDATSKQATAREKAAMARLEGYRKLASQGNEAEARAGFAQDKELQELLHLSSINFNRGPQWLRESGSNSDPKSMDALATNIFMRMKRGEKVSPQEFEILKRKVGGDDAATSEAFRALNRLEETREGRQLLRTMGPDDQIKWVISKAEVFRAAKDAALDRDFGVQDDRKGGSRSELNALPGAPGAAPDGGDVTAKGYVERLKKEAAGGN